MKTILLLLLITLLPSGEEAWRRQLIVPGSIMEFGKILDADFGSDAKDVINDYKIFLAGTKALENDQSKRLGEAFQYVHRRFLGSNKSNEHLNILIKQAQLQGKELSRYDTMDGLLLIYVVYKEGGNWLNMGFDLDKRKEVKSDTVAPITELDPINKEGG